MSITLGVLISGSGTNLQALIDRIAEGRLDAKIARVVSSRASMTSWVPTCVTADSV